MKTPLTYYGGKQRLAPTIVSFLPPHDVYVEPFAGGLAVLFEKPRAAREVINDIDGSVAAFWRAVRDHGLELAESIALTPYSREEWERCGENPADLDDVERARRLLVSVDQSFSRSRKSWSTPSLLADRRGRWQPGTWSNKPEQVVAAATRLHEVAIENCDATELIRRVDLDGVVIYADPPYPRETRSKEFHGYAFDDDGELWPRLVGSLLAVERAQVVLSSYPSPTTDPLEDAGWRRVDLAARANAGARGSGPQGSAPEALWICPRAQAASTQIEMFPEVVA